MKMTTNKKGRKQEEEWQAERDMKKNKGSGHCSSITNCGFYFSYFRRIRIE
jgi:hypothetical protein